MAVTDIIDRGGSVPAVIANGQTESGALTLGGSRAAGFLFPAAWDGGNVTLKGSADGVAYATINDQNGSPLTITPVAGEWSTVLTLDTTAFAFLTLVAASAVGAARTITVLCRPASG